MENVVIVGTGPAGLTAALYTARADLKPLLIEGLLPGGQLTTTTEIENFPGFPKGIDGTALVGNIREQAERFGARFVSDEAVASSLKPGALSVTLGSGKTVETMSLIVATGASALYLGLDSEQKLMGRGVSACATCDGAFYRNQHVAVVGGGDTAMEEATFLTRLCASVTVIHRRDQFRASKIMVERVLSNPKIKVIWNSVVEEVLDVSKNEVTGLKLKDVKTGATSQITVTGVFMAIGHKPNTEAFKGQLDMNEKGFLVTQSTRTNVPGVFAAGDVQDPVYRQAITAAGTGCMAALEAIRYLEALGH
jgi:thioredoxin reductase (NADPH)